jgi:hypothetical protein
MWRGGDTYSNYPHWAITPSIAADMEADMSGAKRDFFEFCEQQDKREREEERRRNLNKQGEQNGIYQSSPEESKTTVGSYRPIRIGEDVGRP